MPARICLIIYAICLLPALVFANVDPVATKKELKQLQHNIDALQQQIKRSQTQRSSTEQALQQAEKAISDTRRKLQNVSAALTQSESRLKALEAEQTKLNRAKESQKSALKKDINAAYRSGRQEYVKLLLNQEQPDKMARLMKFYDYYHQARMARITAFNKTLEEIRSNELEINDKVAELDLLKRSLDEEQQRLGDAKKQRQDALAKLDSSLKSGSGKMKQLQSSQADLEKVLHQVQQTLSDLPENIGKQPFAQLKGKLHWPSHGKMIKRFGNSRGDGKMSWNGVLIGSKDGSPVKAVHHGRVVFADWMRGYGMLIIVDHGDGYLSLYGHNESLLKSPGDWVRHGEVIAYSGNSGGQDLAGLYFEIRKNGKPINPSAWCQG
ncbi:peptidoglycan DD-metalloendopeptidase family protein [Ketobacter sp. MCCC 1A13808]|uniref:murein hydrolase activator EnvC family protein n=1 Tax=Ketobacter sp. MCCC 1A13808 TaxID=2602738 RepID=UPI0012ECA8AC|nr:peptidoglycan DD-metalloendopeptidase family protein [Ketobacter sp. MCCC 1A13808]MVF13891.1 peptidoglycan DD-metalloendopeptidase family protein [Ketobacter sp. MCCC 1A13808]